MNDGEGQRQKAGSPDRFGYEWSTYSQILPESRGQLQRWLGSTSLESFSGKRVLDVGCGMGRNPYWYLQAGAASVLGVDVDEGSLAAARRNLADLPNARVEKWSAHDLDPAVLGSFDRVTCLGVDVDEGSLAAARRNLADLPNARVEKWSAHDLDPAVLGSFDRVTCLGVLHHLADHEIALQKMWSCVAPGGDLVLWCYAHEGNRLLLPAIQAFRTIGSRVPIEVTHAIAKGVTLLAWPAFHVIPWRTDYYRTLRTLSFRNVESIIFDQMLPHIAHYWTRADMERLCAQLGGGTPRLEFVQGNSWHAKITKA